MMTFNDKVQVDVSFQQNSTGMYNWKVYELNPINENDTTEYTTTEVEIFQGTAFFIKKPGSGAIFIRKQFDITSIVNQRKWYMHNLETQQNGRVNLVNRYQIEVASGNDNYRSEIITVCFYHPYPNIITGMNPYDGFVDYDYYSVDCTLLAPLIQGTNEAYELNPEPVLLPKIPRVFTKYYVYPLAGLCSKDYHNKTIQLDCTGNLTVAKQTPLLRYAPYYTQEYSPSWLHKFNLCNIRDRVAFRPTDDNVIANFVETGRNNFNEQWVTTPSNEYVWTMENATLTYSFRTYFKSGDNYSFIGTAVNINPNNRIEGTLWIEQRYLNFIKRHTEPTTFTIMLHASEYDPDIDDDVYYNDYIEFDASWLKDIVLEENETISMPFEVVYTVGGANSVLKFGAIYHHYLKPEGEGNYLVAKINDSGAMIARLNDYSDCTVEAQEYNWLATTDWVWSTTYNVFLTAEFPGVGEIEIELGSGLGDDFTIYVSNYKYLIERLFRVYGTPTQQTNYYLEFRPFDDILGHDWYILFDVNDYIEDWVTYGCEIYCNSKIIDGKTYLTIEIQHTDNIMTAKIAEIKDCVKYYLMWQDRAGGFQCQPFEKTETYSEDFSRVHWETYNNAKRLASVEVQPQWKLNTGFIDDKFYPYYESIFVSPYIELWDIENGTKKRVFVEDSKYTEKTFKNQGRKLFNLELTVKEDTKQHILY